MALTPAPTPGLSDPPDGGGDCADAHAQVKKLKAFVDEQNLLLTTYEGQLRQAQARVRALEDAAAALGMSLYVVRRPAEAPATGYVYYAATGAANYVEARQLWNTSLYSVLGAPEDVGQADWGRGGMFRLDGIPG